MEIRLKIEMDTDNSYPDDQLILSVGRDCIYFQIGNESREVGVDKDELLKALKCLLED
jgi:hypothetical protein